MLSNTYRAFLQFTAKPRPKKKTHTTRVMGKKNKAASKTNTDSTKSSVFTQEQDCYEGERLDRLLKLIRSGVESAKLADKNSLPEKFWFKQQFAVGVNEVTRTLERMSPAHKPDHPKLPYVQLQAIVIASDRNPKSLTKHLPSLAASRNVPAIYVKDQKQGSLRLGELVHIKTAMALGIKVKGNSINHAVEKILQGGEELNIETQI